MYPRDYKGGTLQWSFACIVGSHKHWYLKSQRFRRHQLDIILVIVIGAVVDYRSLHPHITICVSSVEPELGIRFKTTVGKKPSLLVIGFYCTQIDFNTPNPVCKIFLSSHNVFVIPH